MTTYRLFLESGPKRRTTMVHVPELLGCVANGPTTEAALEATPDAIRTFAKFLRDNGLDGPDPGAAFDVSVEEHVTEGMWLGNGDPSIVFVSDLEGVGPKDVAAWVDRWVAIRTTTADLLSSLAPTTLAVKPAKGRTTGDILRHVTAAAPNYVRTFGPVTEANRLARRAEKDPDAVAALALDQADVLATQLRALTPAQRRTEQRRGEDSQNLWTARKSFRRLLEHEWEHHRELVERLGR